MYQVNININIMVGNSIKSVINTNASVKSKEHHACEKDYTWNPFTCTGQKNAIYLEVICDEIIKTVPTKSFLSKTVRTNFDEKS